MSEPVPVRLADAIVREGKRDQLKRIIQHQFSRRSLAHAELWDQLRYGADVVRYLRRHSKVYREISTEKEGPLLLSLGYFRVSEGQLECTSNVLPEPNVAALCKVLSEFLQPGAQIYFGADAEETRMRVVGIGEVERVSG